jgi:hypothetical protein
MFKEMTVQFTVAEDTAFKEGRWKSDRSDFIFEVKRFRSGATAYGDCSGHTVGIINHPEAYKHHYDTRYESIPCEKEAWIAFWQKHIEDEYELKLQVKSYTENWENKEER